MASPGLHENSMHHDRAQRARMPSGIAATCVSGGPTAVAAGMLSANSPPAIGLLPTRYPLGPDRSGRLATLDSTARE